jgi:hypothetical protein
LTPIPLPLNSECLLKLLYMLVPALFPDGQETMRQLLEHMKLQSSSSERETVEGQSESDNMATVRDVLMKCCMLRRTMNDVCYWKPSESMQAFYR